MQIIYEKLGLVLFWLVCLIAVLFIPILIVYETIIGGGKWLGGSS
jgi:hypothetical protein